MVGLEQGRAGSGRTTDFIITMDDGDLENNTVADNGVWRSMVVDDEGWLWMTDWLVVVGDL